MSVERFLKKHYPDYREVESRKDLPRKKRLVYILTYNDQAIVVGQGDHQRAKVIFENGMPSGGHIKAILVRAYRLFGDGCFKQYVIEFPTVNDAKNAEKHLHQNIKGNERAIPSEIYKSLFADIDEESLPGVILRMALSSYYCGISDLRKWRRAGLVSDDDWDVIARRLQISDPQKGAQE